MAPPQSGGSLPAPPFFLAWLLRAEPAMAEHISDDRKRQDDARETEPEYVPDLVPRHAGARLVGLRSSDGFRPGVVDRLHHPGTHVLGVDLQDRAILKHFGAGEGSGRKARAITARGR